MIRALLVAALLAGCGGSGATSAPGTHDITGRFVLASNTVDRAARDDEISRCEGTGGYSDIEQGAAVTLRDGDGNIAGTARLEIASREAFGNFPGCVYTYRFDDVPDADFYAVEVTDRGEIVYSRADLETAGWHVDTRLGD